MKSTIILITILSLMICSCGRNQKSSQIYDNEDILTTRQEKQLDKMISDYQHETDNEIVIMTSKDLGIYESPLECAIMFGKEHGMYFNDQDKGLVIFVSKKMKVTSLATGNQSFEDKVTRNIIDSCMIPFFKEEEWYDGIKVAVKESIKNWN